jgi:hypothetical protein
MRKSARADLRWAALHAAPQGDGHWLVALV